MKVSQIYEILNTITTEILGDSVIVNEDLSNLVDIGKAFQNIDGALDNYVRKLHDHIGKMVFVDRVYTGRAPSVVMDAWEFGSILEKVRANMPDAEENESWELEDRQSYDPNIFYKPSISVKFFNNRVTFEVPISVTEKQVMSSFDNAVQINAFYSMIQTAIQNTMTVKLDALVMRTINAGIGETLHDEFPSGNYSSGTGVKAVNLLYLYNQHVGAGNTITVEQSRHNKDFARFCATILGNYVDRLGVMSKMFNIGETEKFTSRDRLHVLMLSEFKRDVDVYLESDTFHNELSRLPESEPIVYWQGSGTGYAFSDTSAINIKTPSGDTVEASGIIAVMFDRDALGVSNVDRRVTTNYNPKAEFWNEWHKYDAGYFLDLDENFVVFYVA